MILKAAVILFCLLSYTSSQDDCDVWECEESTTQNVTTPRTTTEAMKDEPIEEECECVPYYLCDQKKPDYGEGKINIRLPKSKPKNFECAHYLLKCCDDEDFLDPPDPNPTITPTVKTTTSTRPTITTTVATTTKTTTTTTTPKPTEPPKPKGCGYNNGISQDSEEGYAKIGEFPWAVAIYYYTDTNNFEFICGGTLIHPEVVTTAAHCVTNLKKRPRIRIGERYSNSENEKYSYQEKDVSSITIHPKFEKNSFNNDLALVFLKSPVELSAHINVVCLPPKNSIVTADRCISNGWENTGDELLLKKIDLPIVPRGVCEQNLKRTRLGNRFRLDKSSICAGGEVGRDTCKGDGGSPLNCPIDGYQDRYYQAGIVSWGIECGRYGIPGVYVNVPLFRDWIDDNLKKKNVDISIYQI